MPKVVAPLLQTPGAPVPANAWAQPTGFRSGEVVVFGVMHILLFLKKKKQKDFLSGCRRLPAQRDAVLEKVFWFFFSKKNTLPKTYGAAGNILPAMARARAW
ncbi:hypothetical protein NON00_15740 [Roseomonas sp. GC11]|uniref:hypothetical protein n=1 Tax=Roseomonas sp. GC11 TaxID=2950546 RepID=UPI00210AC6B7|nr:hypothetical protein [Roseomonas sp. GC11]MCQ4161372.1 hypothetical protein [Roseomonas sp. GC11]